MYNRKFQLPINGYFFFELHKKKEIYIMTKPEPDLQILGPRI